MGNDGGSIPKRRELVKEAAKALTTAQIKEARTESQDHAWNHCPLTSHPLAAPVVSDCAGKLYNKDSILEFLLAEEGSAEKVEGEKMLGGRVKGLKDVVEVKFESEGEYEAGKGGGRKEKWVCPVTRVEMGEGAKAVYVVPCGHAVAGSVVKQIKDGACVVCNRTYAEIDVIPILPTNAEDIKRLDLRMVVLKADGLTHTRKKVPGCKKRKKNAEAEAEAPSSTSAAKPSFSDEDRKASTQPEKKEKRAVNGIHNPSTAYLTKKVLEEQEERNKRRKLEQNDNVKSLFRKGNQKVDMANSKDYMTRGFSIGGK